MKYTLATLLFISSLSLCAQIEGKVIDTHNQPLPYVNIYLEDSYTGTTSNEEGNYSLEISEKGNYTIVFQFLGYNTVKKEVSVSSFPYKLDIVLTESTISLDEVVISTTEDPAYRIIRETIAKRKENLDKISAYKANFYSRGIWRVDSVPKKILGQEVGDFDGALDSTRTGIIYLSETISHIAYKKPNSFKETIIASKVSGNDNGFSFNSAQDANFSFYENTVDLNAQIVSPIASNALSYYRYKLDGVFYEGSKLINKIKVTPKRPNDRIWEGTIYIVEDDWQLYGLDLKTTGVAIQVPFVKDLIFKQNFKFDTTENTWIKISQTIDFSFGFLGFNGDGRFIAVYSNYDFTPVFEKKTFSNEVLYFEPEANKKDSLFWEGKRPVQLTEEETNDYIKKDSIQELRKSKTYLDSVDAKNNRFTLLSPLTGYTYKNTFEKWELGYKAPLPGINFNTVQGWNGNAGLTFFTWYDENRAQWLYAQANANYSVAEDRLRWQGVITKRFNRFNRLQLSAFGGSEVRQFNSSNPISPFINSIATLFFERNYMKVYELTYGGVSWYQELFNGVRSSLSVSYQNRRPLFNNSNQVIFPQDDIQYTSNNPLHPSDDTTSAFVEHEVIKTNFSARISFAQKYMTYPDGKFNYGDSKYPVLTLEVENAIGASDADYNFTQLRARINQELKLGSIGEFSYNLKGGTFFNADNISFVDYQHFQGNQTRVGTSGSYTNVFNLLPYYTLSTNNHYFEAHAEHNFKGWVLNKIPGINQLGYNMVVGGHYLSTQDNKPYGELSIGIDQLGWGKYRLLRLDYVQSYYEGTTKGAFIFGLKFLGLFD
ncbi:MAG: hypothetical protein CMC14_13780 [Flavobacteriaceae bacterium]|nr:hypothetical protein [Flavobacteriaceae bacterium]